MEKKKREKGTIVYDKRGKAYKVIYPVDLKEWLEAGYTLKPPKKKEGEGGAKGAE